MNLIDKPVCNKLRIQKKLSVIISKFPFSQNIKGINESTFASKIESVMEPSSGTAMLTAREIFIDYAVTHLKKPYKLLDQNFFSTYIVFETPKNSYFFEYIDSAIRNFQNTGIMSYWISNLFKTERKAEVQQLKVLTLKNLEISFVIWLSAIAVSFIGFIFEIINDKFKPFNFSSNTVQIISRV